MCSVADPHQWWLHVADGWHHRGGEVWYQTAAGGHQDREGDLGEVHHPARLYPLCTTGRGDGQRSSSCNEELWITLTL